MSGKGFFANVTDSDGRTAQTPREELEVEQGKRYRFRVISNGVVLCPLRISVDNHSLEVIASDGSPVEAFEVESFDIHAGER